MSIELTLNGARRRLEAGEERMLLEVLREDLGLTGTKYGCGEGDCRACTVLVDGEAVPSCQMTMAHVKGREVRTIEGLAAGGRLHPVQQAFIEAGAMQCGYCVPGMILAAVGLLEKSPSPQDGEIVAALNGHLCRCCGYLNIIQAVRTAASRKEEKR
jgi:aerobic-type carbon monoxide dehydrogenase small subunit (CoxS/CutS family)